MKKWMLILLSLFFIFNSYAESTLQPLFDVKKANRSFDKISIKLSTQYLQINTLQESIDQLNELQQQAKSCVTKSEALLNKINLELEPLLKDKMIEGERADIDFLKNKKTFYTQQLSDCQLFVFRSEEALSAYKTTIRKISTHKIIERSTPIWKIIDKSTLQAIVNINTDEIIKNSAVNEISDTALITGAIFFILAMMLAYFVRYAIRKKSTLPQNTLPSFIVPIFIFGYFALFSLVVFSGISPSPSIKLLSYISLGFVFLLALSSYLFSANQEGITPLSLTAKLANKFKKRFAFLVSWLFLGGVLYCFFREIDFNTVFVDLVRALFITLLTLFTAWFLWLLCKIEYFKENHSITKAAIRTLILLLTSTTVITEWLGFHELAIFLLLGTLLTLLTIGLFVIFWRFINYLFDLLIQQRYRSALFIRSVFGIKPHRHIPELIVLRLTTHLLLIYFSIAGLFAVWGGSYFSEILMDNFINGFQFSNFKIIPLRLLFSVLTFCFMTLIGRFMAQNMVVRQRRKGEIDRQNTMASLMLYVIFCIALIFAFIVAGLNLTGLAIVAGALSVGVGLGLQHIVENIASGIVLLLEKPIKPGDRVLVNNTEGYVKKIRLRSTQITTLSKEDIIVPNANLINNQLTNYMFRDRYWRLSCKVGVVYGSNLELVKKVLIEVACGHNEVVNDEENKPRVLFREFGDSSLIFELWCVIKDVNKKNNVKSDLHYAIDAAFRKNKITIAFPQRDIHIKRDI